MNLIAAGPMRHDPDRREDAEHQREHHLHAGLGGRFFRALAPLGAQRLRVHAQRLRDAGAELVGLHQHRHQRRRRRRRRCARPGCAAPRTRALPARSSRLISRSSSRQLGMRERQLVADALNRLVEAEAGFDADDQQVERVGQRRAGSGAGAAWPSGRAPCSAAGSRAPQPPSAMHEVRAHRRAASTARAKQRERAGRRGCRRRRPALRCRGSRR